MSQHRGGVCGVYRCRSAEGARLAAAVVGGFIAEGFVAAAGGAERRLG